VLRLDHEQQGYFTEQHAQLVMAIANQTAVAIENARLYQQAQQLAAMEERQRLARELHDSVAQTFYSISLSVSTLRETRGVEDPLSAAITQRILSLCDAGLAEIRGVVFALRPETIEREGLVRGLQLQIAALQAREDIAIEATLCEEPSIPLEVKEALYRVAQEALRNVMRHSSAKHATVRLANNEDRLELEIADDGVGFEVGAAYPGLGLRSMRERIERLHGDLDIISEAGHGTRVLARLPSRREGESDG
jgi:signal transduction histidine kinase